MTARQECRTPLTWVRRSSTGKRGRETRHSAPARAGRAHAWARIPRVQCRQKSSRTCATFPGRRPMRPRTDASARVRGVQSRASPPPRAVPSQQIPHVTQPILSPEIPAVAEAARARITAAWLRDETEAVLDLLDQADLPPEEREAVIARAAALVTRVRARAKDQSMVEAFMRQYDLSSEDGVLLMCVA